MKINAHKILQMAVRLTLGLLLPLCLLAAAVVGYEADAYARRPSQRAKANRATGRTIQKNLLPPVTMPRRKSPVVTKIMRSLAAEYRRIQTPSRRVLRRMLRSRRRAVRAIALRHIHRRQRLMVSFADVARIARSSRARLSNRLLAIRALLLEPAHRRQASRLLLRLTHGGAESVRQAAYRALNRLPRDSRARCRRFGKLVRRRGMSSSSKRLVAQGFARNCMVYSPRAVLRAARHIRTSVRRGIAEGIRSRSRVGRRILARLARDAHRLVRLSARNAVGQSLDAVHRPTHTRPKRDFAWTLALHHPTPWSRTARSADLLPRRPMF